MINQVYQLVSPRQIEVAYKNKDISVEDMEKIFIDRLNYSKYKLSEVISDVYSKAV